MAEVIFKVIGGERDFVEADTVGELRELKGMENKLAAINGEAVEDDYELSEDDVVVFADNVKGN